ncbi:hypothetical protein AAE478_007396 [Parahypoxylon ruwenzoriense]
MAGHEHDGRLSDIKLSVAVTLAHITRAPILTTKGAVPPATLRSALRLLVSQGAITQKPFVEHIRARFRENPPHYEAPSDLFAGDDVVTQKCLSYLAQTRCVFSCKLGQESLPYLEHFLKAIPLAKARWTSKGELATLLAKFDGDVVQAIQALKETRPEPSPDLLRSLVSLLDSLQSCEVYCQQQRPPLPFPFTRARRQVRDVVTILFPGQDVSFVTVAAGPAGDLIHLRSPEAEAATSDAPTVETFRLGSFDMPRLFNGLWQVSSPSWGAGTAEDQEAALARAVEVGLTAADMADHYGDAELIYGEFRNKLPPEVRSKVYAATKWCIFSPLTEPVTTSWVLDAVRERSRRLGGGRVELLQFHWYDYSDKQYLPILDELVRLTRSHPTLVSAIGLCNFDSAHVEEACEYLLAQTGEVGIVSNQVQYLDILLQHTSWPAFQSLLAQLSRLGTKHRVPPSLIALRWVLQQPAVGAVLVGTRLSGPSSSSASGASANAPVFSFALDAGDLVELDERALGGARRDKVAALYDALGDCGGEYRGMH